MRLRILLSSEVLLDGFLGFVLRGPMYWVRSPSAAKSSSSLSSWFVWVFCAPACWFDGTSSVSDSLSSDRLIVGLSNLDIR